MSSHSIEDEVMDEIMKDMEREAEVRDQGQTRIEGQISGRRDWVDHCVGHVEFCMNGPQGGGPCDGGFLRVAFTDDGCTYIQVSVDDAPPKKVRSVAITFRGDAELNVAIDSFEFLVA